jgi:ankyrin repeat protein
MNNKELFDAVEVQDFEKLKNLFKNNDITDDILNSYDEVFYTLLHKAILKGNIDIVNFLISNGANISIKTMYLDETPLLLAVKSGNIEITKLLISKGADINVGTGVSIEIDGKEISSPRKTPICYAVENGNYEMVKLLIDLGAELNLGAVLNVPEVGKIFIENPLFQALKNKFQRIADLLILNGANVDPLVIPNPLNQAIENGFEETVELLISKGADISNFEGRMYTLHNAVKHCSYKIVKILISKGANVNAKDNKLETPIFEAVRNNNYEIVSLLISENSALTLPNIDGDNLLIIALKNSNNKIAELLLSNGLDVNVKDEFGLTLLHRTKDKSIADWLIDKGADLNLTDNDGNIPYIAFEYGDIRTLELVFKDIIRFRNSFGKHFSSGSTKFDNLINQYIKVFKNCVNETSDSYTPPGKYSSTDYTYNFNNAIKSIEELANFRTPISSNLLHLLTTIKDFEVTLTSYACGPTGSEEGLLSFSSIRDKASSELRKLGNPRYNSKAFWEKGAYKISFFSRLIYWFKFNR